MKFWVLTRGGRGYDEAFGFVVRASSESIARALAAAQAGDEGAAAWIDRRRSVCEKLTLDGAEGVVMRDFNAG